MTKKEAEKLIKHLTVHPELKIVGKSARHKTNFGAQALRISGVKAKQVDSIHNEWEILVEFFISSYKPPIFNKPAELVSVEPISLKQLSEMYDVY